MAKLIKLVLLVVTVMTLSAPLAYADFTGSGSGSGSGGGGGHSAAGDPGHATVDNCSLYATSSSFGMWCVNGDSSDSKTVLEILGPDSPHMCWDQAISAADATNLYGYPQVPGTNYYLHSCLTMDPTKTVYDQTGQLNQNVVELPPNAPDCPRPYHDDQAGRCLMHLTARQQLVVDQANSLDGQIPGIVLTTLPSTRVRTNEAVAYVDAAVDGNGHRITRTRDYAVGTVTMWAQMTGFHVYPYGPGTTPELTCDGTAQVGQQDTPQSLPDACWWTYPHSSSGQPGNTYPLRLEADWSVYYRGADGTTHTLASFQKYDDVALPVYDIQALVID